MISKTENNYIVELDIRLCFWNKRLVQLFNKKTFVRSMRIFQVSAHYLNVNMFMSTEHKQNSVYMCIAKLLHHIILHNIWMLSVVSVHTPTHHTHTQLHMNCVNNCQIVSVCKYKMTFTSSLWNISHLIFVFHR